MATLSTTDVSGALNPELFRFTGGSGTYPNPLYRYIHSFIPSNLLELFSWCEFIYNNSPQLATSIRRFSEYPVTEIVFPHEDVHVKKYKQYCYDTDLKQLLMGCGIDFHIYGNAFISPYYPFLRLIQCSSCKRKYNIEHVKFVVKGKTDFYLDCPECKNLKIAKIIDKKIRNPKKLKWIRWNPKDIEIEYNEISGEYKYHMRIPPAVESGVKQGNLHMIKTTPMEVIDAIKKGKRFTFANDSIYHMKAHTPSGFVRGWGFPILTQALYEILHIAVLKRANEAIAWEHIVPKMILSPSPSGASADPLKHINMSRWRNELETAKSKWNKDPNYVMFTPFPVNVQQLGGNGRSLLVSAEIESAERSLAMALGIPLEFAAGTLAWQTSAMSLRLLKNQMHVLVSKLERLVQWMMDRVGGYLNWPLYKVTFAPFELADDEVRKQYIAQLNSSGKVSDDTFFVSLGLDYTDELEKLKKEKIQKTQWERDVEKTIAKDSQSITEKNQRQEIAQSASNPQNDVNYVYSQAEQLAQIMQSMGEGEKRKTLEQLKMENPPLHAMTKELLGSYKKLQSAQMEQEAQAAMEENLALQQGETPPQQQGTPTASAPTMGKI